MLPTIKYEFCQWQMGRSGCQRLRLYFSAMVSAAAKIEHDLISRVLCIGLDSSTGADHISPRAVLEGLAKVCGQCRVGNPMVCQEMTSMGAEDC